MLSVSRVFRKVVSVGFSGSISRDTLEDYALLLYGRRSIWYEALLLRGLMCIRRLFGMSNELIDILSRSNITFNSVVYRHVSNDLRSRYYAFLRDNRNLEFIKIGFTLSDRISFTKEINFYSRSLPLINYEIPQMLYHSVENSYVMVVYNGLSGYNVERNNRISVLPIFTQKPVLRRVVDILSEIDRIYMRDSLSNDSFYKYLYNNLFFEIECGHIHGDLGSDNILRSKTNDKNVVIIDWEHYNNNMPLAIDKLGAFLGDNFNHLSAGETVDIQKFRTEFNLSAIELFCAVYYFEQSNFRIVLSFKNILRNESLF